MDRSTTIWLHADAPDKPAFGEACNGCGVCCVSEPCPVGMLVSRTRRGRCHALAWDDVERRYRCGLLARTSAAAAGWRARLVRRWIGAGIGCDSSTGATHH